MRQNTWHPHRSGKWNSQRDRDEREARDERAALAYIEARTGQLEPKHHCGQPLRFCSCDDSEE